MLTDYKSLLTAQAARKAEKARRDAEQKYAQDHTPAELDAMKWGYEKGYEHSSDNFALPAIRRIERAIDYLERGLNTSAKFTLISALEEIKTVLESSK